MALAVVVPTGALAGDAPATKYFVEVWVSSLERAQELQAAGFDVAGINRAKSTVGIVATDEDLQRLWLRGETFDVVESNKDLVSILALQDYTDPQEMSQFMDQVVAAYPDLARKITLADTLFEGQQQYALKITQDVTQPNDRPSFILDAQHHAREVMTPEIARDMIDYLTSRYATDANVQRWVDNINIYVVGSVNPDGAMYVFQSDSMWRKNRHPSCAVDINRNYPFLWDACDGSSASCYEETTRGEAPGSEPETQGMLQLTGDVRPFFTLSYHSYGEYIMYSYGCSDPDELLALDQLAQNLNNILSNDLGFLGQYDTGPIGSTLYAVDGGSIDTQYGQFGAYTFTIEVNSSSFQPDYATWRDVTVQRQRAAWQFFLDETLDTPQIRGKVTDAATADPLAAEVSVQEVTYTHGEAPRHADARGLYHWLARNGQTYHLTFSMPGYCTVTRTVVVGDGPVVEDVVLGQPSVPQGVIASGAGDNRIDVSWEPAANADEYHVLRSLASGGPYTEVATVAAPGTSYQDVGVSGQVTYYYVVYSTQGCDSPYSAEAEASTSGPCTAGPAFDGIASVTNPAASTCALDLAWSAGSVRCGGRLTYSVYRSTTSPFTPSPDNLIVSGLGDPQYTDHGAIRNKVRYYYIVRAVDSLNGADDGNTVIRSAAPTGPYVSGTWFDDAGDLGSVKLSQTPPWSVQATGGLTSPRVYATGTYPANVCAALTTPAILLQSDSQLRFASKYDIEGGYDAGIVEVATGPDFDSWTKLSMSYPDALASSGNACGFPPSGAGTVFSRTNASPTYSSSPYSASLAAYGGQEVKVRWLLSTNGTGTRSGWWVDDVFVTNVLLPTYCSAGAVPSPGEVSPPAAPMICARSGAGTAIEVTYEPGCGTTDNVVYWGSGPITGALDWTGAACAVGNTGSASFDPGDPVPGSFYYFVIAGENATAQGSYGQGFDGVSNAERPPGEAVASCDKPQDLSGICP